MKMKTTEAHRPRYVNGDGSAFKNVPTVKQFGAKCFVHLDKGGERLCHHLDNVLPGKTCEETVVVCVRRGRLEGPDTHNCPEKA